MATASISTDTKELIDKLAKMKYERLTKAFDDGDKSALDQLMGICVLEADVELVARLVEEIISYSDDLTEIIEEDTEPVSVSRFEITREGKTYDSYLEIGPSGWTGVPIADFLGKMVGLTQFRGDIDAEFLIEILVDKRLHDLISLCIKLIEIKKKHMS